MQEGQTLQSIGKYRVEGVLGRGSMGVVYRAEDPEIGRTVAIKILRRITSTHFHDADAALGRFKNEARSAGQLRHPNIITVFDVNVEGDIPYIVMDYVEGESLDVVLSRNGPLDVATMLHYLSQVADGLDAAHKRGVIHRDIKPSNLLVDPGNRVYILDFGVAKINETFTDAEKVVRPEPVMGTPGYMSPEQVLNEPLDSRSDLFSLAIVAFECLVGQRPFPGNNFTEIVGNILKGKPISLTSLQPDLPLALEAEVERALSRKREDRFSTAVEMVTAFSQAAGVSMRGPQEASGMREVGLTRSRKNSEWKSLSGMTNTSSDSEGLKKMPNVPFAEGGGGRKRRSTGEWGVLGRQLHSDLDSFSVYSRPEIHQEVEPGDVFSYGDRLYGSFSERTVKAQFSPFRVLTAVFATACIVIAGVIVWTLYTGEPGGSIGEVVVNDPPTPGAGGEETTPITVDRSGGLEALEEGDYAPVPTGKKVPEMTDAEVLGVLVSENVPEALVLLALREAKERRVPKFLEASVKALDNDSYVVRVETIKIVASLGDKRIVPKLVTKLDDHDPVVRLQAANALGALGSRAAIGYLSSRYLKEGDARVKSAIRSSIEKINGFPMP